MHTWFARLVRIDSSDEEVQRRGQVTISLTIGLFIMTALFIPVTLLQPTPLSGLIALGSALISYVVGGALVRRGHVTRGASLILVVIIVVTLGSMFRRQSSTSTAMYLILPIMVAGLVLRPRQIWVVTTVVILGLAITLPLLPPSVMSDPQARTNVLGSVLLMGLVTMVAFLGSRSTSNALKAAYSARAETRLLAHELKRANSELEQRIADRTAALQQALAEREAQAAALETSVAAQHELIQVVSTLSVPVIPITQQVLVVPLVGTIDQARSEQILQNVLQQVEARRAQQVFLDITGVAIVDTVVAAALLQTAAAMRLLGAEPVLIGVRPDVAQALVSLGADLSRLRTVASLEAGLESVRVARSRA